eukprot:1510258-Prymnesium_polylepis.1
MAVLDAPTATIRTERFWSSFDRSSAKRHRLSAVRNPPAESRLRPRARASASAGSDEMPGVGGGTASVVGKSQPCSRKFFNSRLAALIVPLSSPSILQNRLAPRHDTSTRGAPAEGSRYLSKRETQSVWRRWWKQAASAMRSSVFYARNEIACFL